MIIFKTLNAEDTLFSTEDGRSSFNDRGPGFVNMKRLEAAGEAEIVPYVAPPLPDVDDIELSRDDLLDIILEDSNFTPGVLKAKKAKLRAEGKQ